MSNVYDLWFKWLPRIFGFLFSYFTSAGKLEFPFEVPLEPKGNKKLYDTYHGVFVNIQVYITSLWLQLWYHGDKWKRYIYLIASLI